MSDVLKPTRRGMLLTAMTTAVGAMFGGARVAEAASAPSIKLWRTYSMPDNSTRTGELILKGTMVKSGETSIVPAGCHRLVEGAAQGTSMGWTAPNNTTEYHNDPAQQHRLTLCVDGCCRVETHDGKFYDALPGELMAIEDSVGEGHKTSYFKDGFLRFYVSLPANV